MTNLFVRCGSEILSSEEMHAKNFKTWVGSFLKFNVFKPTSGHLRSIAVAIQCNMQLVAVQEPVFLLEGVYCIIYSSKLGNKMCSEVHKYNAVTVVLCVNLFLVCVRVCFYSN